MLFQSKFSENESFSVSCHILFGLCNCEVNIYPEMLPMRWLQKWTCRDEVLWTEERGSVFEICRNWQSRYRPTVIHTYDCMIKITLLSLISVNDHKKTVKKRCASEMGCDYFFNVQNYTVHGCQLCTAQLCNEGSRLELFHAFFLFTIILFLLISN